MRPWKVLEANGRTWLMFFRRDPEMNGEACDGITFPEDRTIILDSRLKKDKEELWHTIMHELMHAAFWGEDVPEPSEEELDRVARNLAQLLRPWMKKL